MTQGESMGAIEKALAAIAPEVDVHSLDAKRSFREQAEIDSFDFLNFLVRLHELTGIDIPESAYAQIDSLDGLVAYLGAKS